MIFKNFANSHSTIGSMEDLDAATVEDVKEFFRIYYAPNNAVLVISGAFETKTAKDLVKKYFESIPKQTAPKAVDVKEPSEIAMKYDKYVDPLAPFPAFIMGWKVPSRDTKEFMALDLAGKLLYDGESSRLYQKLVKGEEAVVQLFGITDERRGPSAILIGALPKPDKDLSKIRQTIIDEIKDMSQNGPTAEEMQKLRNQLLNDEARTRQSSLNRARKIAEYALYDGDPNLINSEINKLLSISAEDIKNAVNKHLNTENRALLDVVPPQKEEANTTAEK